MDNPQYGTYSPDELMPLIPSLFVGGNFLTLAFFPGVFEFDTAFVHFDRVLDDKRMAPLVAPLAPGKIQQPRGYRMETLVPASIKPKNQVNPNDVLQRLPGEALGGEMDASDRATALREKYLMDHQMKIWRRKEWMASSILRTGSVTLVGDDYPSTVVNFSRTGSLTKTLTLGARWGETGVSPYDDTDDWMDEVATESGSAVDIVVMDRLAWQLYIADPKAQKALDRQLGQTAAITLGLTPTVPGAPVFKGRDGGVEFYVYNDNYEDDAGAAAKLIPDYTVLCGSRGGIAGSRLFGVVQHAENNYEKGEYFPHNWVDPNTGAEWIETITAPILAPKRINASLCATVR
jgi:Phage major capsid protein E